MLRRLPNLDEHHFLHELDRQLANATGPVTATDVGNAIDLDARESVEVLAGLFGLALAKEAGADDDTISDPYTLSGLEITWRGTLFLRDAEPLFD